MTYSDIYETDLEQQQANYAALTPISFLQRAAAVFPRHTALIHADLRRNWLEVWQRSRRLAAALQQRGIGRGHTVSFVAANTPELFEAHFGVPMSGAVLNAINIRLDAAAISFILQHAETRILFVDKEFSDTVGRALAMMDSPPLVIDIDDPGFHGGELIGDMDYEAFLLQGQDEGQRFVIDDEWQAIALNYTSGTTGDPKGVVYHHRGAHLNAVSNILCWQLPANPVYLWTLPMFHCNGWCFPWTLAAVVGSSVCLRHVREEAIFSAIREHQVTHFCGAPVVLNLLANADPALRQGIDHSLQAMTAGAAPPAVVIAAMEAMNIQVTHAYGLTETYGPSVVCEPQAEWASLDVAARAELTARQGVRSPMLDELMVADPESLEPVPRDGQTMGEVFMRGNLVMKGYLKNPATTERSFAGGWFHSGDLAVWHEDGYIEVRDRSKDIIISGGENISSIEVEAVLFKHPQILEAAVVACPDEKWGEVPCAFVSPKSGVSLEQDAVLSWCREHLAGFKVPKHVVFGALEKTSTGKVQKYLLRERARTIGNGE